MTLTSLGLHFQSVEWVRCPGRSDVIVLPIGCTQLPPAPHFFPRSRNSRAMRRWGQAKPSHFIQEETQARHWESPAQGHTVRQDGA